MAISLHFPLQRLVDSLSVQFLLLLHAGLSLIMQTLVFCWASGLLKCKKLFPCYHKRKSNLCPKVIFPAGWIYYMSVCGVPSFSKSSSQCGHSAYRPWNVQSLQNQMLDWLSGFWLLLKGSFFYITLWHNFVSGNIASQNISVMSKLCDAEGTMLRFKWWDSVH